MVVENHWLGTASCKGLLVVFPLRTFSMKYPFDLQNESGIVIKLAKASLWLGSSVGRAGD